MPYDINHMRNLKIWYKWTYLENRRRHKDRNKLTVSKGEEKGKDQLGAWDQQVQMTIYKTDKQQGPPACHRRLYSKLCNKLWWKKMYTHMCTTEALCCRTETNTKLYINYTSIEKNKNAKNVFT